MSAVDTLVINFDDEYYEGPRSTAPLFQPPSEARGYLLRDEWTWQDLRDYVVAEIERRFGPRARDMIKEKAIFASFLNRWGPRRAQEIARYVFDHEDGRWRGQPVTVNRFCKNSDPYFACPIAERLAEPVAAAW